MIFSGSALEWVCEQEETIDHKPCPSGLELDNRNAPSVVRAKTRGGVYDLFSQQPGPNKAHFLFNNENREKELESASVFVVDDDSLSRRAMARSFSNKCKRIKAFSGVLAAIGAMFGVEDMSQLETPHDLCQWIKNNTSLLTSVPDLIISDTQMPSFSGADLLLAVQQFPQEIRPVFIATSAGTGCEDVKQSMAVYERYGVPFYQKPFILKQIMPEISSLLIAKPTILGAREK